MAESSSIGLGAETNKSIICLFSFLSQNARLKERYSHSHLKKWKFYSICLREKKTYYFKKIWQLNSLFWKYQSRNKQKKSFSKILARIVLILIFVLVSWPNMEWKNSRSRLEHETERKKFPFLSWNTRLKESNSHSRLESWYGFLFGTAMRRAYCRYSGILVVSGFALFFALFFISPYILPSNFALALALCFALQTRAKQRARASSKFEGKIHGEMKKRAK